MTLRSTGTEGARHARMLSPDVTSAHALVQSWLEARKDLAADFPPDWPADVWVVLVGDFPDLRLWAAHSRNAPEEIVRTLARDEDWQIRSRIAERRGLPRDLFESMAQDPFESVRKAIASNAKSPLEIVERLTRDPVDNVARVAAYNLRERLAKQNKK